jgi:hypothetical protein
LQTKRCFAILILQSAVPIAKLELQNNYCLSPRGTALYIVGKKTHNIYLHGPTVYNAVKSIAKQESTDLPNAHMKLFNTKQALRSMILDKYLIWEFLLSISHWHCP